MLAGKLTVAAGLCAAMVGTLDAQVAAAPAEGVFADRIVALVNESPVFESDLVVAQRLGVTAPDPDESEQDYRHRLLDRLIDERLRYAAVRGQGHAQINLADIEEQIKALIERFGGTEELRRVLADAGMNVELLREMLARQLVVWNFVENRLGARVFVDLEEIEAHYNGELTSELESAGEPLPPLRQVREDIREVLYERKLTEEVDRWTAELRFQADVSVYLDQVGPEPASP